MSELGNVATRIEWMPSTGSTNSDLVAAVTADPNGWPEFSVLGTDFQTEGRGRAGRAWQAPAGSSLFVSVLLRPPAQNVSVFGWLPLLAGLAVRNSLASAGLGDRVKIKWPNDVLVGEKKISGVLSEFVAPVQAVVIGAGVNLFLTEDQLPVETATSLSLEGATNFTLESILSGYLRELRGLYEKFALNGFDANRSGLRSEVVENCVSLNRKVRAVLPGDKEFVGTATNIDDSGRITIIRDGEQVEVSAGDIVHLRHFDSGSERIGL